MQQYNQQQYDDYYDDEEVYYEEEEEEEEPEPYPLAGRPLNPADWELAVDQYGKGRADMLRYDDDGSWI